MRQMVIDYGECKVIIYIYEASIPRAYGFDVKLKDATLIRKTHKYLSLLDCLLTAFSICDGYSSI